MLEKLFIRYTINKNKRKYKQYFEQLKKSNKFLYIRKKSDFKYLFLVPKFSGITLGIKHDELFDKKLVKAIIEYFYDIEIELYEKEKLFTNDDIKELYNISRNIKVNTQYFEKYLNSKNEIYSCDIDTYMLIIEKVEFLKSVCTQNFISQDEQFMFVLTQILKYIKYVDYHDFRTCMANSILLGTGVCIDFTIALYKCLTDIGIECEIVKGIGNGKKEDINSNINLTINRNHAWNQVKIDGKWYNVDITWFLSDNNFDWILANDKIFTKEFKHLTNQNYHHCSDVFNKQKLERLYESFMKFDSIWKKFDMGDKECIIREKY